MSEDEEWDALLDPDERVIWQGRPSSRIRDAFDIPGFLVMTVILVLLYAAAHGSTHDQRDEARFGVGFLILFFACVPFWKAFQRSRASYLLTNKRAFISYRGPMGHKLDIIPITPDIRFKLKEGRRNAVLFAEREDHWSSGSEGESDIGFEMLDDPHAVYQLLRSVQRGTA
ncbi:hypothetical protein [uncultured Sulfitobacter sp.]|uniref:hypothetical protein n=1 Tax=uncultured Sulfitobacter sp. TaxID=191468 RepID=UPI002606E277|nr:hypothetical protein [uncultured Sulfitobacter sp.]